MHKLTVDIVVELIKNERKEDDVRSNILKLLNSLRHDSHCISIDHPLMLMIPLYGINLEIIVFAWEICDKTLIEKRVHKTFSDYASTFNGSFISLIFNRDKSPKTRESIKKQTESLIRSEQVQASSLTLWPCARHAHKNCSRSICFLLSMRLRNKLPHKNFGIILCNSIRGPC